MNNEIDNIGDLFRNTLKDHHIDSDAHLWSRLETQLSAQPPISVPKTSVIHHLTWIKAAVAASVIISAALAFNYIYLPLKNATNNSDSNKTIDTIENKIDSPLVQNEIQNSQIETKQNLISTPNKLIVSKKDTKTDDNSFLVNNNSASSQTDNPTIISQQNNTFANTSANSVANNSTTQNNNAIKAIPKKDSIQQPINNNFVRNQSETIQQNTTSFQESQKDNDLIKDADIPNVFTPNSDGVNDYFVIKNIEKCNSNHLVIKDRNGRTIFEKLNYQNDWDGHNVADGVYFFFLKYNANNNNLGKMGSITIKRQ